MTLINITVTVLWKEILNSDGQRFSPISTKLNNQLSPQPIYQQQQKNTTYGTKNPV